MPPHPSMAPTDATTTSSSTAKRTCFRDSLHFAPKRITGIHINGNAKPSAQNLDLGAVAALVAGTWMATVTLVDPAPATIVRGVIVIVEPVGPPLAESVTAAGKVDAAEGAMVRW